MFKSIRWKITVIFVLLVLATELFIGGFNILGVMKHYHDDFNGGSFVTDDLPAHISKEKSDTIPSELKSLYGSVVSE